MDASSRVGLIRHLIQVGHELGLVPEPDLEEIANARPEDLSAVHLRVLAHIAELGAGILNMGAETLAKAS